MNDIIILPELEYDSDSDSYRSESWFFCKRVLSKLYILQNVDVIRVEITRIKPLTDDWYKVITGNRLYSHEDLEDCFIDNSKYYDCFDIDGGTVDKILGIWEEIPKIVWFRVLIKENENG